MPEQTVYNECVRCGHTWPSSSNASEEGPATCPDCRSPYWDVPRKFAQRVDKIKTRSAGTKR